MPRRDSLSLKFTFGTMAVALLIICAFAWWLDQSRKAEDSVVLSSGFRLEEVVTAMGVEESIACKIVYKGEGEYRFTEEGLYLIDEVEENEHTPIRYMGYSVVTSQDIVQGLRTTVGTAIIWKCDSQAAFVFALPRLMEVRDRTDPLRVRHVVNGFQIVRKSYVGK